MSDGAFSRRLLGEAMAEWRESLVALEEARRVLGEAEVRKDRALLMVCRAKAEALAWVRPEPRRKWWDPRSGRPASDG